MPSGISQSDQLQKNLQSQLTEIRKAQDALRKSVDARRKLLDQLHATKQRDSEEDTNDIISDDEWTQ